MSTVNQALYTSSATPIDALSKLFPKYQFLRSLTPGLNDIESFWCFEKDSQRHRLLRIYHCPQNWKEVIEKEISTLTAAQKIHHANLVNLWDCWALNNQLHVVTDYIEAPNLRETIKDGRLGLRSILKLAIQLAEAVHALHSKKIPHGCITPNHIFVSNEFLKLSPPTIESFISACHPLPPFETAYLSADPDLSYFKKDLFSIGSILFFLSTGYPANAIDPALWKDYGISEHLEETIHQLLHIDNDSSLNSASLLKTLKDITDKLYPEDREKDNFITKLFKLNLTRRVTEQHLEPVEFNAQPSYYSEELKPHEYVRGEIIGERFEVIQLVEREDFDIVYKAKDTSLHNREVLLHYFANGITPNWKEQFELVSSQLSKVNHPHISQIIDAKSMTNGAYLITQREDGEKLRLFMNRHSFSYAEILDFAHQVLDALRLAADYEFHVPTLSIDTICVYRHSDLGYFYRLTSVGHAHFLDLVHGPEKAHELMMKPETLPPELYDGARPDEKASQFILGNIIFHMLVESHPCEKMSLVKAYEHHQAKAFPSVADSRSDIPTYFQRWLKQLMEPETDDRFASLSEAFEALCKCPKS